jgi:hypothetical protein
MRELPNIRSDTAGEISRRFELAMLFEVSAYPKKEDEGNCEER